MAKLIGLRHEKMVASRAGIPWHNDLQTRDDCQAKLAKIANHALECFETVLVQIARRRHLHFINRLHLPFAIGSYYHRPKQLLFTTI
jgi:hypothetical protein